MNADSRITEEWMREWARHPLNGEKVSKERTISIWDSEAGTYSASGYSEILPKVIDEMDSMGLLDGSLIDIGCGTGAYALPFCSRCSKVVAVDSSEGMLNVLRKRCRESSVSNIDIVDCDCAGIPDDSACDTAFSSLCPAMNNPDSVLDMERLGKRRVYISSSDAGEDSIEIEIWRELGCDYSYRGYMTDYPFRFLESLGRKPSIRYFTQKHDASVPAEKAAERYRHVIGRYRDLTDRELSAIDKVISKRTVDGSVSFARVMRIGMIIW